MNEKIEIDPLVRMAVMHYQFEAIHPFTDGNGRTGRILNVLYLIQEGLLEIPILYLSRYFLEDRNRYNSLLQNVTEKAMWENWILYILEGMEQTSMWTTDKITKIQELFDHTRRYVRNRLPRIYSHELIGIIFKQPYCRITNLINENIAKRQTGTTYLKKLVEIGVLQEMKFGREKLYIHPKFLKLLKQNEHVFQPYDDQIP